MRTKTTYRKKTNKENETLDKADRDQDKISSSSTQNDSDVVCNPSLIATREEIVSTNKDMNDNLILSDISNKDNDLDLTVTDANSTFINLTSPEVSIGRKRSIEELSDSNDNINNETNFIQLKKKCLELEERLNHLEMTSMVQNVADHIPQTVNQNNFVFNHDAGMLKYMDILNIDSCTLSKLKKKTSTATARSILNFKFPNPAVNFKLADVDETLVDAIAFYSKQSHPNDSLTIAKIKRAMSNYFAFKSYKMRLRSNTSIPHIDKQ